MKSLLKMMNIFLFFLIPFISSFTDQKINIDEDFESKEDVNPLLKYLEE